MNGTIPLLVHAEGLRVVAVGAGPVAAAKLAPFLAACAEVTVIAPSAVDELVTAAAAGRCTWHRRRWEPADLDGAALVLAATADGAVNAEVVAAARARQTLVVRVDAGGAGTADVMAALRHEPLVVAVATGGAGPALSRALRERLATVVGPEWGELARLYGELRTDPAVRAALAGLDDGERRRRWRSVPLDPILRLIRLGAFVDAKAAIRACLYSSSD